MDFTFKGVNGSLGAFDNAAVVWSGTAIAAGDFIAAWVTWNNDIGAASVTDGTSTFEAGTRNSGGVYSGGNGQWFFLRAAVAIGSPSYIFSGIGAQGILMHVFAFTPAGVVAFDNQLVMQHGTTTSFDSGALATGGSNALVLVGLNTEGDATPITSKQIGGASASTNANEYYDGASMTIADWYLETTGSVAATATLNASLVLLANVISFRVSTPPTANKVGSLLMAYQ